MKIAKAKKFTNLRSLKKFYDIYGFVLIKKQLNQKDLKLIQKNLNTFFYKYTKLNFNKSMIYLDSKSKKNYITFI